MHAAEREDLILHLLSGSGFISFRELEKRIDASPATIRRDLERMAGEGRIERVRGGARRTDGGSGPPPRLGGAPLHLSGTPFDQNVNLNRPQKQAIGRAAAALCRSGEAVMIDGGSTTLQMCPHIAGLNLQVLTNSLHIVSALLPQADTRLLLPAGSVFREQNIILGVSGEDSMPNFHAPRLFMGAAGVGPQGLMQADVVLAASERRLIARAQQLILLVDSLKFGNPTGTVVCELGDVDILVTDAGISQTQSEMVKDAGIELIVAE